MIRKLTKAEKAKRDCIFFAENYLKHLLPEKTGEFHKNLIEIVNRKENERLDILAPRGHAKSTWITIIYVIWKIVNDREITVIIASDTIDQAETFLRLIKDELEYNENLIEDFGLFRPKEKTGATGVWRVNDITVVREGRSKEPTIMCAGAGKKIVGRRADIIIVDDPLNDENTDNERQRFKTYKWFMKTLSPIAKPKTGKIIVIGTKKHIDDLHAILAKNTIYKQYIFKAIDEEKRALWPEVWPYESLMKKREEIGELFFEQEYQNEPLDETNIIFKDEPLDKAFKKVNKIVKGKTYLGIYLPLHTTGNKIEDMIAKYSVYVSIIIDENDVRYLKDIHYFRGLKIAKILDMMKGIVIKEKPEIACIEQEIFDLLDMHNLLDIELPIRGHDIENKNNIYNGLPKIIWLMEKNKISFKNNFEIGEDKLQMLYEKFKYFDINERNEFVSAYWLAEQAFRLSKEEDNLEIIDDPTR